MANKTKVTPQKDKVPEKEGQETPSDSPLLDLSDAAVKKLIRSAEMGIVAIPILSGLHHHYVRI
jgi:hypothetical protein